jgi:hypothetical protein
MQLSTGVLNSLCPSTSNTAHLLPACYCRQYVHARAVPCCKLVMQTSPKLVQSQPAAAQEPTLLLGSRRAVREWRQHCWPGTLLQRHCSTRAGRAGYVQNSRKGKVNQASPKRQLTAIDTKQAAAGVAATHTHLSVQREPSVPHTDVVHNPPRPSAERECYWPAKPVYSTL